MIKVFELVVSKSQVTKEDFFELYNTLTAHLGTFSSVKFHILMRENHFRYFVESDRDLSSISGSVHFCVLREVQEKEIELPKHVSRERFVNFVTSGSLTTLKEKMSLRRGKMLEHFVCQVTRVNFEYAHVKMLLYFKNAKGDYSLAKKITNKFPAHLFAMDFEVSNNFMRTETPKYLNIEKALHIINSENMNAILEVDTFPYFPQPYYLALPTYEFDKHSMIVGASGSGKSKFIELFIDRLSRMPNRFNYRVVVIDPHANLAEDLKHIDSSKIIDFKAENTELFAGAEADTTAATELTSTLMKSLMGDSFNPRVERVMRFTLYVLFTAKSMSLSMLKRFLTDVEVRQQVLDHVQGHVPHNISHFFATDYNEIRTAFYNEGILPIIAIVDELELQPALMAEGGLSIQSTIRDSFLTVFSLNKVSMGEKVVKTIAGLLIQQIFLLAQSRAFNEKVLLFIDEVSVVQNPALSAILSEARKFNLFVILTQQYFAQVDKSLRDSIFANVSNYYCFRVAEEDAIQLVGNLPMELPNETLVEAKEKGIKEETIKIRHLTDLHPRECIVRIASNGMLLPCFKAKTLDTRQHVIETSVTKDYKPQMYEGPVISIDNFFAKAEAAIEGAKLDSSDYAGIIRDLEPFVLKDSSSSSSHLSIQNEPPPDRKPPDLRPNPAQERPVSLDAIMNEQSTKENGKE
ncbi:type IV secretion system DNA-binding domain-containing protein [Candidatus Saccharibacteria bacterium]|nr:MAG: type IV secretion system DNA-binding domain-containing protein [Candidatus Saccharibacteria bacterium]